MTTIDFSSDFGKRALERLTNEQVVWITTVSRTGKPQPSPVWFLWQDETFLIYSQPETPKVRAIAGNSNVSLNFNATETGGNVVVVQGDAEILTDDHRASGIPAYIEKYTEGLKSVGMTPESFSGSYSVPIRVTPSRLRGF